MISCGGFLHSSVNNGSMLSYLALEKVEIKVKSSWITISILLTVAQLPFIRGRFIYLFLIMTRLHLHNICLYIVFQKAYVTMMNDVRCTIR